MAIARVQVKVGGAGKAADHDSYLAREDKYKSRLSKGEALEAVESGNMPAWAAADPRQFWRAADLNERKNGTTYREHELALPRELTPDQRKALVRDWVAQEIGDRHAYRFAIHRPKAADGEDQPHAHLMFSERQVDGIERGPDTYFKRYNAKAPEKGGARKGHGPSAGKTLTAAERAAELRDLRGRWADLVNSHLERAGSSERIDMRSYAERGIDRAPEPKQLPSAWRDPAQRATVLEFRQATRERDQARAELRAAVPDPAAALDSAKRQRRAPVASVGKSPPPVARGRLRDLSELPEIEMGKVPDLPTAAVKDHQEPEPTAPAVKVPLWERMNALALEGLKEAIAEAEKQSSVHVVFARAQLACAQDLAAKNQPITHHGDALKRAGDEAVMRHLAPKVPEPPAAPLEVQRGELVAHGRAPYRRQPDAAPSYFVSVRATDGKLHTHWGVGLESAMEQAGAKVGDQVTLAQTGKVPVTMRDKDGTEKTIQKNVWGVQIHERLKAKPGPDPEQVYAARLSAMQDQARKAAAAHIEALQTERQQLTQAQRDHQAAKPWTPIGRGKWEARGAALDGAGRDLAERERSARTGAEPAAIERAAVAELRRVAPGVVELADAARNERQAREQERRRKGQAARDAEKERTAVGDAFAKLAERREDRDFSFRDGASKWKATPAALKDRIEEFNSLPKHERPAALERINRDPATREHIKGLMVEREQTIKGRGQSR